MDNKRLRELAGVIVESTEQEKILGEMAGETGMMADKILQMAEDSAYDEGAEAGNVTSDQVHAAAKQILADLEQEISQKLQGDMG